MRVFLYFIVQDELMYTKFLSWVLFLFASFSACTKTDGKDKINFDKSGEEKLSLNGQWSFSTNSNHADSQDWIQPGFSEIGWDKLKVPGNWDTENTYSEFIGTGYYRKEFTCPANLDDGVVRLCFDAVNQTSDVWLNGQYLGKHIGGYTPFEFDITSKLLPGKTNVIALSVNNEYQRGAWWHWGGISREVNLIRSNRQRIVWQQITAEPDLETGRASLSIAVKIKNHSNREFNGSLVAFIKNLQDGKKLEVTNRHSVIIAPNTEKTEFMKVLLNAMDVQLWDTENPNLYMLSTTLQAGDMSSVHQTEDRFGIRKIETKDSKLLLNGNEIHFHGFNRVSDHWAYGQTEPDHLVKFDIDAMKAMGCNFTRIMHHPQAKNLLEYCDEVGMLLIEEIPVWGKGDPQIQPGNPLTKQWLSEMITRDFNHPCIIGWSVANEPADVELEGRQMSPRVYAFIETMLSHVESLDSTRLKTYVSFTAGSAGKTGVDPADLCDIICFNTYGDASRLAKRCHEVWPDKPIFVTEIGRNPLGNDLPRSGLAESLQTSIKNCVELDYVVGCVLWTYNDYRSNFADTPIDQCRTWGVYNAWRQPKKAATEIQHIFTSSDQHASLPSMAQIPDSLSGSVPTIWAVVPLENSCMLGFSVLDEKDNYEIEYTHEDDIPKTVEIIGLRGAAKVYDLEPGSYSFRIRRVSNGNAGEWSSAYETEISAESF
jgi:hypothetical protein